MSSVTPPAEAVIGRGAASEAENEETDSTWRLNQQMALDFHWVLQALHSLPVTISQPNNPSLLPQFRTQWNLPQPSNSTRVIELPDNTPPPVSPARTTRSRFARRVSNGSSSSGSIFSPQVRASAPQPKSQEKLERDAYDQFIADVKRVLDPLTSQEDGLPNKDCTIYNEGSVFLCWGSAANSRVLNVKHIQRNMDHELFWKRLNHTWYQARGEWRRKIPWYGIRDVKMVDIRLVGPIRDYPDQFYGVFQLIDEEIRREKEELKQKIKRFQEIEAEAAKERWRKNFDDGSDEYDFDDYDDYDWHKCAYDAKLGRTLHGDHCIAEMSQYQEDCNDGEYPESENRLNGLMMESLRTSLFQNPQLAVYHKLSNSDIVHYRSNSRPT
ncbi:unnamed protein product [Clonostachys rosea]|uniref:Uncharacterized protein n=1 Tax=Bionectria ochroleuca TaxID=29856 RepID=A0ABY6U1F5_BIOOC|nr:unnamed protein product [Clonostachys rosea]